MPRRIALHLLMLTLVAGTLAVTAAPAAAAKTCFGKRATIVGSNTDPRKPVDLIGTPGNDVIVGLSGWDDIYGRGGDDLICSGNGDDYVKAGGGDDKVKGQGGLDTLYGGRGHDRIWGGADHSDSLGGGPGNDRLFGGAGDEDSVIGGPGDDYMHGGPGYDLVEFWESSAGVVVDLRAATATGHGQDEIVSFEGIVGSNFDDTLFGNELSNMIQGGAGDDSIESFDSIDGGFDLLRSGGGNDTLDGGAGWDMVSYNLSPYPVEADLATGEAISPDGYGHDMLVGIEHLVGSKHDDVLNGDDGDNAIIGNRGNDVMDGRGGSDEAAFFDTPLSVTADMTTGTAVAVGWGSDTFVNFENLQGSGYRDVLIGDDGPNIIWGGGRADSLQGLGGDDVLIGHTGIDDADGGDGTADECDAESQTNCEIDLTAATLVLSPTSGSRWSTW